MDLLPKVSSDFSSEQYWESFFKKRQTSFEWYGNYLELCGILHRYIKVKDDILVIGCGNSELSENIFDAGYHSITNIDISKTVIAQMKQKNLNRNEMKWLEMDVTKLEMDENTFSVVLDKGTLDAMLSDRSMSTALVVDKMFDEISRVIKNGGRYICISLAQDHIIKKLLDYFPANNWLLRVHKVWNDSCAGGSGINMPIFAFIFTKFIKLPQKIFEICLGDSVKPSRVNSEAEVLEMVKSQQYYARIQHQLNNETGSQVPPIHLYSNDLLTHPRYTINVVDSSKFIPSRKFGIFIIPQGRELEWLFNSKEGRIKVAESAQFKRLAVVSLSREHKYEGGIKLVQDELSNKVVELKPKNLPSDYKIPFLSIGGDKIGERYVRHKCKSAFTGTFIVEDYLEDENVWHRQLLFESQCCVVQSSVRLRNPIAGRKKKNQRQRSKLSANSVKLVPDESYLSSEYTRHIISALPSIISSLDDKFKALVIGLGGGTIPLYLLHNFPASLIHAIELDGSIVDIATQWFGLDKYKSRLSVHVQDGIEFVQNFSENLKERSNCYDMVVVDVNTKDESTSMKFPPVSFVQTPYLEHLRNIITESGVLVFNLLCRDDELKSKVKNDIRQTFPNMCETKCETDVNEVIYCFKRNKEIDVASWRENAQKWAKQLKSRNNDEMFLCEVLDKLKIT